MKGLLIFLLFFFVLVLHTTNSSTKSQTISPEDFSPFSKIIGPYSITNEEAWLECEKSISCAGITSVYDASTNDTSLYALNFLPKELDTEHTQRSPRTFTIHSGRIKKGDTLSVGHAGMTVAEAKTHCQLHPKCVAFTYPVNAIRLNAPDNIAFVSSVDDFSHDGLGEWRTYISNDLNKAKYVNETSIEYDDHSYPYCCEERDIPSIEDIEAVDTLERISCNISREEFYETYEKTRTPVMLVGCDENWKARERWTIDKLLQRFSNSSKWRGNIEDDPDIDRDHVTWGEVMNRRASNKWFYIFDNGFQSREENKQLEEDYDCPRPFKGADLYGNLKEFRSHDFWFRWFLMAPRGTGSYAHIDPQATDAWNTLVQGHKWWILYPDADFEDDDELQCDRNCSESRSEEAWFTSVGVNALRNECSNGQFPQHILQKPGETIYVPYPQYHAVFNMDDTTCVTANFGSTANLWSVWHEIVLEGEEHSKRAYYEILNKEQRKQIRDWNLWPVQKIDLKKYHEDNYDGDYDDEDDSSDDDDDSSDDDDDSSDDSSDDE